MKPIAPVTSAGEMRKTSTPEPWNDYDCDHCECWWPDRYCCYCGEMRKRRDNE